MLALGWLLAIASLLLGIGVAAASFDLHGSAPAGNALGQAYTAFGAIALWILLGILLLVAMTRPSGLPGYAGLVIFLVWAAAGASQVAAVAVLSARGHQGPAG